MSKEKKLEEKVQAAVPICFNCKKPVTEDDHCYGCGAFVCNVCDATNVMGRHNREDHLEGTEVL